LRSPEARLIGRAGWAPLLRKEIADIVSGRALWLMLLILCPLVGYTFLQAVSLYAEASLAARDAPVLATGLSPLDGMLVPTFGAFYVAVTLLFPFVAIRALGHEKESGALRLLLQLPYRPQALIAAKLAAVLVAWLVALVPVLSALACWRILGGHIQAAETVNLLFGHLLYGLLVGAIALFCSAVTESAASAAIVALAFTLGSWVLDFATAGRPGLLDWLSRLSLTQMLRVFEQGLLSFALLIGMGAAIATFAALAAVWLPTGVPLRTKVVRSAMGLAALAIVLGVATQVRLARDLSEDRRNSFPSADERLLGELKEPLIITVHLVPEDPRYVDLRRNILSKLERTLPRVTVRLAGTQQSMIGSGADEDYGAVDYVYGGRAARSRSTSHREVLPVLYGLAGVSAPAPGAPGDDYPGYPLIANAEPTLIWFCGLLPLGVVFAWWLSRRPPAISLTTGGNP
jgi:hypothetical protein